MIFWRLRRRTMSPKEGRLLGRQSTEYKLYLTLFDNLEALFIWFQKSCILRFCIDDVP